MLSINIPVYNIEVNDLVSQLHAQAEKLDVPFEIRVYDDGSQEGVKNLNQKIPQLPNVVYVEFEKNLGRAAIRNKMGFDSKFGLLLFIDADSRVVDENYLENYLKNQRENCVLCGGTAYSIDKPSEPEKFLRWFYGSKREAISAAARNSKKGFIITSNNFLIEKKIFVKVHFRDEIRDYGHEDTVLGFDLFSAGIKIVHIDNPLEHTGLEDAAIFIEKTKMALTNLKLISEKFLNGNLNFIKQVWFLNRYKRINKIIPAFLLCFFYRIFHIVIERNLKGKNPRLFWFDVYKLTYFATQKNREQTAHGF